MMMKKVLLAGMLAVGLTATSAQAALWFENFENGLTGWNLWTERGTNTSQAIDENPVLGDIQPFSGANETMAQVSGNNFNGGIWTVVSGLPTGEPLMIDGFWRTLTWPGSNAWAEVIVVEGNNPPVDGVDLTGPLIYKTDSWDNPGGSNGQISTSPLNNLGGAPGTGAFSTASGTVTVVLKVGNVSGTTAVAFDDVSIVPEPSAALLLAMPGLALLRRRRRLA